MHLQTASEPAENPAVTVAPVFSPQLPAEDRKILSLAPHALLPREAPMPRPYFQWRETPWSTVGLLVFCAFILGVPTLVISWVVRLVFGDTAHDWTLMALGGLSGLLFALAFIGTLLEDGSRKVGRRQRGHYLCADDLDAPAQALLLRARAAMDAVLGADVQQAGLLDRSINEVALFEELWEIAESLYKQTRLRAHQEAARTGHVGATLSAVLEAQRAALDLSVDATTKRVRTLEEYAERVTAAEAAYHEQSKVHEALDRNDDYLDLVASASAQSDPQLRSLAEDAQRLETALQYAIDQAIEAGRPLALPPESTERTGT